jgi:hypothetical protein
LGSGVIILVGKLAYNAGAAYSYYNHFLTPFVVIAVAWLVSRIRQPVLQTLAILAVAANLYVLTAIRFPIPDRSPAGWDRARDLIEQSDTVYVDGGLSHLAYAAGKPIYYSRMADYAVRYAGEFPDASPELTARCAAVETEVLDGIRDRRFERVLLTNFSQHWPEIRQAVDEHYQPGETLELHVPVELWVWWGWHNGYEYIPCQVYVPKSPSVPAAPGPNEQPE